MYALTLPRTLHRQARDVREASRSRGSSKLPLVRLHLPSTEAVRKVSEVVALEFGLVVAGVEESVEVALMSEEEVAWGRSENWSEELTLVREV